MTPGHKRRALLIAPVAEAGGSDRGLLQVVRALSRAGWEPHVALPAVSPLADELIDAGAAIHTVPMRRITRTGSPLRWAAYCLHWPLSVLRLRRLANSIDADLIYTNSLHSWYGWMAAALLRRPHIWHAREIVVQSPAALRLERLLTRHFAEATVAMSEAIADQFRPGHVTVVYEAPDQALFSPSRAGAFRSGLGIPDDMLLVGSVGRLDTWKGVDVLLDAVKEIRSRRDRVAFVVAGPPVVGKEPYAEGLATLAQQMPDIWWVGARADIPELMADLDVFVLPSTEPEPYGLVVVEALASGVPVVATAAGGPVEILRGRPASQGRLVPAGDSRSLAEAVAAMLPPETSTESRRQRRPIAVPTTDDHVLTDLVADVVADYQPRSLWSRSVQAVKVAGSASTLLVLPVGSKRRHAARESVRRVRNTWFRARGLPVGSISPSYPSWLRRRTPSESQLAVQRKTGRAWKYRPLVSVCIAIGQRREPPNGQFADLTSELKGVLESVLAQSYEQWELCVCPSPSLEKDVRTLIDVTTAGTAAAAVTVTVTFAPPEEHSEAEALATAVACARGDFLIFVRPDAVLARHALHLAVRELQRAPGADVLYSDDDFLSDSGVPLEPFLKPGWSPELLLSIDYVSPFLMARRTLVEAVGGVGAEHDGAHLHDLALRLSERTSQVLHIPEVLCSRRRSDAGGSTASGALRRDYGPDPHVEAVQAALERRSVAGQAGPASVPGGVHVRYALPDPVPHVEILIPTRDRLDLLRACIDSVRAHTDYPDFSITIVDNDSEDPATNRYIEDSGCRVIAAPGPFNYSAIMNKAVAQTDHEFILTLNNDTLMVDDQWLTGLVELCARPSVGLVGCRLIFPTGRVQHEGIVIGHRVPAANLAFETVGFRTEGQLSSVREVSSVTGACCLMRRTAWAEVEGFDETLTVSYNDVDFGLRLWKHNYSVLYTPHVTVVHDEHATRGAWHPSEDERIFRRRWGLDRAQGQATCDPFFSPHLTLGPWGWHLVADGSS